MVKGQRAIASEMSRRLGKTISTATVGYWKSAGAPISAANSTDPDKLEGWYRSWIDRNKPDASANAGEANDARMKSQAAALRVLIAKEKLRKLTAENDLRDKKLIPIEEAAAEISVMVQTVRQQLERMPDALAVKLVGKSESQIHAAIAAAVRQTLEMLSRPSKSGEVN